MTQKLRNVCEPTPEELKTMGSFKDFPKDVTMVSLSEIVPAKYTETVQMCSTVVVEHKTKQFLVQTTDQVPVDAKVVVRANDTVFGVPVINSG